MFADSRFEAFGLRQARVQVSWDLLIDTRAAQFPGLAVERERLARWFAAARAAGIRDVLLAIKSSRDVPAELPDPALYTDGVSRLLTWIDGLGAGSLVKAISPWNEPNLSGATRAQPAAAGALYRVARELCRARGCTPVAGDFADRTLQADYLANYLLGVGRPAPAVWGWHAYEDAWDRARDPSLPRLRAFARALPAGVQIWLTEQGGIVSRVSPGDDGRTSQSAARAAADLAFLLRTTARIDRRITRFDVYQFRGEPPPRWDSGLIAPDGRTRTSYEVFRRCVRSPSTCT